MCVCVNTQKKNTQQFQLNILLVSYILVEQNIVKINRI